MLDKLTHLFMKFPGIGARQSKRFVYFLLAQNPEFISELVHEITRLKKIIIRCRGCFRFYQQIDNDDLCDICVENKGSAILLIVEKDADFENIRRSGSYRGLYFILGGTIPFLSPDPHSKIRIRELILHIETCSKEGLSEIILALSANPEGDFTREYITKTLFPITEKNNITITSLGRGLSTGSELEYSDADTLSNALKNRGS